MSLRGRDLEQHPSTINEYLDLYGTDEDFGLEPVPLPWAELLVLRGRNGDEIVAVALVDKDDLEHLRQYRWTLHTTSGYVRRSADAGRRRVLLHTEIMRPPRGLVVDHINGNKLDNRRWNLRMVTPAQNGQNIMRTDGTSGYRGVSWHKASGRWRAQLQIKDKQISLGYSHCEREAGVLAAVARSVLLSHSSERRDGLEITPAEFAAALARLSILAFIPASTTVAGGNSSSTPVPNLGTRAALPPRLRAEESTDVSEPVAVDDRPA